MPAEATPLDDVRVATPAPSGLRGRLDGREWRLLGVIAAASFFDQYDRFLLGVALPQIQASLAIGEADVGVLGATIRMGALPALLLTVLADRMGRRKLLLLSIVVSALLTGMTAFAPDARTFVALQVASRTFLVAQVLLSIVVLTEEVRPESRGFALGVMLSIHACGAGLGAALFSFVDSLPMGWRALYLVGLCPLAVLPFWRRALPETRRFEAARDQAAQGAAPSAAWQPFVELWRAYPGRLAATSVLVFVGAGAASAPDFLAFKYLQQAHAWSPGQVGLLTLAGGAVVVSLNPVAGWASDRLGRRPVLIVQYVVMTLSALAFFHASGPWLIPLWMLMISAALGADVVGNTLGAELFPTSHRSTAAGARMVVGTLAASLGLLAESALYTVFGSHWIAVSVLIPLLLLAPLIVWLAIPETASRTLEEVSPERP